MYGPTARSAGAVIAIRVTRCHAIFAAEELAQASSFSPALGNRRGAAGTVPEDRAGDLIEACAAASRSAKRGYEPILGI